MNKDQLYQVYAGEGEVLHHAGSADTLRGAQRIITRERNMGLPNISLRLLTETGEYMRVTNPYDPDLPSR